MPYKIKGKCVYKKDSNKKVGCTKKDPKKYLSALYASEKKRKLKEIIKSIVTRMLLENEENFISDKQEKEINNFDQYLKLPQNIGISFTQKEKDITVIPNINPPFSRSMFEIRYKSVEDVMSDGQMVKTNKTTVIKKIKYNEVLMYKSFTLIEPTEKPKESPESIKEASPPPVKPQSAPPKAGVKPPTPSAPPEKPPTDVAPTEKPKEPAPEDKPKEPEVKEPPKQKVIEITSDSFSDIQGNPELLVNFLKSINEDVGL